MKSLAVRLVESHEQPEALRLLAGLNPEVATAELERRLAEIVERHPHYELYAAFDGDDMDGEALDVDGEPLDTEEPPSKVEPAVPVIDSDEGSIDGMPLF